MTDPHAYFRLPGVSSHALIEMLRSPLHCWAKYVDPDRPGDDPTPALRFGTLVHTLLLTPALFERLFAVADGIDRRTKAGKARYAALRAADKLIIAGQEQRAAHAAVAAIHRHPVARDLFAAGAPETILTVARQAPLWPLKGRLDWVGPAGIVELKTAADASPASFLRAVYRHGYHLSAAYYRMLAGRVLRVAEEILAHTFVVVESQPPYAVAVYPTSARMLAAGQALWETQLARFDECWHAGHWPGYPVEPLDPAVGSGGRARLAVTEGELEL